MYQSNTRKDCIRQAIPSLNTSCVEHHVVVRYVLDRTLTGSSLHRNSYTVDFIPAGNATFFGDAAGGHGTHVCGSVAGARPYGTNSFLNDDATGAAPKARLSFMDLSDASSQGPYIPFPPHHKLLPVGHKLSSRG